ncbi:MAG: aminodeoxychorismate synthase component I [Xanthomonadaceae bacterium]|nr:aminodeoxychorismate synthase component I [Xanthomonadaceae bacterium]
MIVSRALPAGCDLLRLHRLAPARYPMLLQSTSSSLTAGHTLGRWDMLLIADGEALRLEQDGTLLDEHGYPANGDDFLSSLDDWWRRLRLPREEPRWPFRGGWALFLGYELAAQVEPVLRLPRAEGALPVALALRCPAAVLRDHASGECTVVAESGYEDILDEVLRDIAECASDADDASADSASSAWSPPASLQDDEPTRFVDGVKRILDYLAAGDVFQVNLSRAWRARCETYAPEALYARLRDASPAPFAGLFAGDSAGGRWAIASSSPERLVSVRGEIIETRPIAGTRPRFVGDDDAARIRELVGHPKERAEHVMLIDLERNDLGRVCAPGSVEVDELMTVESYSHVHHIVSNVRGRLREDISPGEAIRAVFPGGTITGCPKVRCMQIIAELEGVGRGAYTGAMGWLNRDGDLDLNILIRSVEIQATEGGRAVLRFRTGAGIVADSDPQRELDETRAKARGLLQALGHASFEAASHEVAS